MSDERIAELLRDAPVPDEDGARVRALRVVRSAGPPEPPPGDGNRRIRTALAFAVAIVASVLVLSPAGATVSEWVGDVVGAKHDPAPALRELPSGGELLVQGPAGPWVVHSDGSQRFLGRYDDAAWSPRGLYVAVTFRDRLTAIEPNGEPHWTITAPGRTLDPRWSDSGFRIAYRSGANLRVVAGDGTGDRLLARHVAPVAPAWRPGDANVLAYLDRAGRAHVVNTDSGRTLFVTAPGPDRRELTWSDDGRRLAVVSSRSLVTFDGQGKRMGFTPYPVAATFVAAHFRPGSHRLALIWRYVRGANRGSSELFLSSRGNQRLLLPGAGRLSDLTWSPDGSTVLVSRPAADDWVFVSHFRGHLRSRRAGDIARQFAPGARHPAFPAVAGWCCSR